jgi:thioredoxin reductase/bacterioferritin-associated ferredoxin
MTAQVELAVVGAGPAGIAAALTAGAAGVAVVLLDAQPRPGGQYFRTALRGAAEPVRSDDFSRLARHGAAEAATTNQPLLRQLTASTVQVMTDTVVWGAFPAADGDGWELALHGPHAPARLIARALILATGAYDRPIPFPGWTLPGVMTAGGVQAFLKGQRIAPGRRFLLSGNGPLQIAVAAGLVQAGAEVVALLEASRPGLRDVRHAPALWGQWGRLAEAAGYARTLLAARVPLRLGWAVTEARGDGQVEAAVICRLDATGRPIAGSAETVAVDTIAIGYGLIPATELSRQLGCEHDFLPERGGYAPRRDAEMRTSLRGVFAVGDGAGIGGAELAQIEGRIAAVAAARDLGRLSESVAQAAIWQEQPDLVRQRRFAAMLAERFAPPPGLDALANDATIICRCEEVTLGDIRRAVADGATAANEVKGLTRAGMGNCQGRICGERVARIIAAEAGHAGDPAAIRAAGCFTARPPIHPLPLEVIGRTGETGRQVGK